MSFNPSISLPDVINFILIGGGILAIYFKDEKKSDERILKTESELENVKSDIKKMESSCNLCKSELNQRINEVDSRGSNRYDELTRRMESMEKSLKTDIQNLGQTIIKILSK